MLKPRLSRENVAFLVLVKFNLYFAHVSFQTVATLLVLMAVNLFAGTETRLSRWSTVLTW